VARVRARGTTSARRPELFRRGVGNSEGGGVGKFAGRTVEVYKRTSVGWCPGGAEGG